MGKFKKIREWFWPLLEKNPPQEPKLMELEDIQSADFKETLNQAIKFYESEKERKQSIEQKSSIFIGIISVITSIIIAATTIFASSNKYDLFSFLLFFSLFIFIIYISRTLWFSLKALERKSFYTVSVEDFLSQKKEEDYYKELIVRISNKAKKNFNVINEKVDNMTMAQEYFKRAIIVIVGYACIIFIYFILNFIC